jgi:flavin-dependent dehydrogenase/intein/homing endonuclease
MTFDFVIVGGGTCGSYAAWRLAEKGYKVLCIDSRTGPGSVIRSTGAQSNYWFREAHIEIPDHVKSSTINGFRVYSPNGDSYRFRMKNSPIGYVLYQHKFEQWLAEQAIKAGAEFRWSKTVTAVNDHRNEPVDDFAVEYKTPDGCSDWVSCKNLVIADGPNSPVGQFMGLAKPVPPSDMHQGIEYIFPNKYGYPNDEFFIYWGSKVAKNGYCWFFAEADNAKIGNGVPLSVGNPRKYLMNYLTDNNIDKDMDKIDHAVGGLIPTAKPYKKIISDDGRIVISGDAARMVVATSVPPDEPVLVKTADGLVVSVPISELENGKYTHAACLNLSTYKTEFAPIQYLLKHRCNEQIYEVRTRGGRSVRVTASHNIMVYRNEALSFIPTTEIQIGDLVAIPSRIKIDCSVQNNQLAFVKLFGYYMAEGYVHEASAKDRWHLRFIFGKHERDTVVQDLLNACDVLCLPYKIYDEQWKLCVYVYPRDEQYTDKHKRLTREQYFDALLLLSTRQYTIQQVADMFGIARASLVWHIRGDIPHKFIKYPKVDLKMYIWPKGSKEKYIPSWITNSDDVTKLEFLRSYLLGDGTLSHNCICFTTASKYLAHDLVILLLSLDVFAVVHKTIVKQRVLRGRVLPESIAYRVVVYGKESLRKLEYVWKDHWNASKIIAHLANPTTQESAMMHLPRVNGIPLKFITKCGYVGRNTLQQFSHPLANSDIVLLEVVNIQPVEISEYVYDISVPNHENFIAGFGGVICHNTGGGIHTALLSAYKIAEYADDLRKYQKWYHESGLYKWLLNSYKLKRMLYRFSDDDFNKMVGAMKGIPQERIEKFMFDKPQKAMFLFALRTFIKYPLTFIKALPGYFV